MRRKLLIVEDQVEVIDLLHMFISKQAWDITTVINYDAAQTMLHTHSYDLVVTDFSFPGGDGNKVATLAREKGFAVWLHTGDVENPVIDSKLYDSIFPKLSKDLVKRLSTTDSFAKVA